MAPAPASVPDSSAKAPVGTLAALWPFVRAHRGLFAGWLVALACSSTATLSLPVAFRQMIDQGFSSGANIDRAFVFLFLVALALALATAARFFFVTLLGERVVADMRQRLYTHLLGLDAAFYDRTRSGELVSRLTADAELLRSVVGSSMSVALRSLVTVVGSIAMLFVTSPHLASYSLVGIPLAVLPIVIGVRLHERPQRTQGADGGLGGDGRFVHPRIVARSRVASRRCVRRASARSLGSDRRRCTPSAS